MGTRDTPRPSSPTEILLQPFDESYPYSSAYIRRHTSGRPETPYTRGNVVHAFLYISQPLSRLRTAVNTMVHTIATSAGPNQKYNPSSPTLSLKKGLKRKTLRGPQKNANRGKTWRSAPSWSWIGFSRMTTTIPVRAHLLFIPNGSHVSRFSRHIYYLA
jgi:hypothetical protein